MAPVVGYWDIRGYTEPIRMILHHLGIDFEDKRYAFSADLTKNEWIDEKETLGLEFPNLPYFIDGDVKITQSLVIVRYLADKYGLSPSTDQGKIKAGTLVHIARDLIFDMIRFACYPPPEQKELQEYADKRTMDVVKRVSDNLGDKQWFVEDKLTYADFVLGEALDQLSYMYPQMLKDYPNIVALIKRLYALPNVEKYMQGGQYRRWPLFSPFDRWGGGGEEPKREF